MNFPKNSPPPGQVLVPAAAIGTLALVLSLGLGLLGILQRVDAAVAGLLDERGMGAYPERVPEWAGWLFSGLLGYGLALAMLSVPGTWRRVLLWVSAAVVTAAWAPVLALASREPAASAAVVAVLWSGLCSLVYASRHRMECDLPSTHPVDGTR
jgi:hypothetical protein